jgi:hypothetical protein
MTIKRFVFDEDYERISKFLTEQYMENKNMVCWLPQRFDDLVYRIETLYKIERGKEASSDYIFIFEENDEIVGVLLPDGDSFNSAIKKGYEYIFPQMLDIGEKELYPLFEMDENGEINFCVVSHDCLTYQAEELKKRGYVRDEAGDYDNVSYPMETNYEPNLPEGFKQVYGEEYPEIFKMRTCHYGFHPDDDDGNLFKEYAEGGASYHARKKSKYYKDCFESMTVTDDGDGCSYAFCYVDMITKTAFVEPVSTREKYRHKGLCREMLHGIIRRCKEMGIEKAYVNSYDWRKKVYNSSGFATEETIGFWHKKIKINK